jgi:hypothetical protein
MLSSSVIGSQKLEVFDECDVKNKQELRNLLDVEERVLFSGHIPKINKHSASQDRMLIITNKNLYNVQPDANILTKLTFFLAPQASVKRKIPIDKIWGITISSSHLSDQFVIHTEGDYDYRYDGKDKREKIFKSICNAYFKEAKKDFPLYVKDDQDLSAFQTTDDDLKAGVDKKPKEGKINVNRDLLAKGLVFIIENRQSLNVQTSMRESSLQRANTSQFGNQSQQQSMMGDMRQRHNSAVPQQGGGPMTFSQQSQMNIQQQQQQQNYSQFQHQQGSQFQPQGSQFQQQGSQFQQQGSQFQSNNSMQINMNAGSQQSQMNQIPLLQNSGQQQSQKLQQNGQQQQQNSNPNNLPVYDFAGIRDLIKADLAPYNHNVNVNFALNFEKASNPQPQNNNVGFVNSNYNPQGFRY